MSKINVLHIPSWFPNNDDNQLGIFVQKQIKLLDDDKYKHIVLYLQGRKESKVMETTVSQRNNFTLIHVTYPSGKNIFSRTRNFLNSVTTGLQKLLELNQSIDLIHCHVASKNLWIAKKFFPDTPCVLSEHWSGFLNGNFEKQHRWKQRITLKRMNRCDAIIAVSPLLAERLKEIGVTAPIEIVGNVIDVAKQKNMLNLPIRNFLVVADLDNSIKNITGILEAFSILQKEKPDSTLTIIGDGIDAEKLKKTAKNLNINASFLGRLSNNEVLQAYHQYDALIVNSNYETYSMVTAEALLSGIPVLSSNCGGAEQFITPENGIIIPKNNPQALTKALLQISESNTYSPQKIISSVAHRFEKSELQKKLETIYQKLIKSNS